MEKILLVEDNKKIASALTRYLGKLGYHTTHRDDGVAGHEYITEYSMSLDLIILDIKLPGVNGIELCEQIRKAKIQIPILMLTEIGDVETIVHVLDQGADDYLTKPFALPEVYSRIKALLRRPAYFEARIITAGDLEINLDAREARYKGMIINLRRREFDLLSYLAKHKNQMLAREQILLNVWHIKDRPYQNNVDVHVKQIRNKLKKIAPDAPPIIQTVYGFGYKLTV